MVRIMHVSDTHLGAKEYSMDAREEDVYQAFREALDIAVMERVDMIVHSGDLFDVWSPSNRALAEFKNGARKIHEKNIPMFLIMGDHDRPKRVDFPAAKIFDFLGLELLGMNGYEGREFDAGSEKILVGGISNIKGLRVKNLPEAYGQAENDAKSYRSSILLSHQAITPYFFPPAACEATKEDLPTSFSYLAFGHVHDSFRDLSTTAFAYAGSTEIASVSEITGFQKNGKGVNIIDLDRGEVEIKRIRLKEVRYQYNIRDATPDNYMQKIEEIRNLKRENEKKPVLSIKITGESDTAEIISELKKVDDFLIRFPVTFQKEYSVRIENVEYKMSSNLTEYLERYFGDSEKAIHASEVMKSLDTEDQDEMFRLMLKRYGLDFLEKNHDN